jgi:hypothetical protein
MERLAVSELQKQALWLFGVLLGVAIKEAIASFHADVFSRGEMWNRFFGALRILLFLFVSLRFYLGAIQYFNAAFGPSVPASELRRGRLGWDLALGLIHFALVCFWGLSITPFESHWSAFPAFLGIILLYDLIWYLCAVSDTRKTIRIRVVINVFTASSAALVFGSIALGFMCFANGWRVELTQSQGAICEVGAYVPVIVASAVELGRLVHGRPGVEEWLGEALPRA